MIDLGRGLDRQLDDVPVQVDVVGVDPRSAWMLDVFGHDPAYPGLMADAGLDVTVETEGGVNRSHCALEVVTAGDNRDSDFRGGDHLHVDSRLEQRGEELSGNTRVGAHAATNNRELADVVVVREVGEANL